MPDRTTVPTWARPIATSPIRARSRLTAMLARLSMSTSHTSSSAAWTPRNAFIEAHSAVAQSDDERPRVAFERTGVRRDRRPDDRDLAERRVDDVVAQVLVALEHEAEDRRRGEEQREHRQEPPVGEHRGVAAGLVPPKPVERLDGHVDDREAPPDGHHPGMGRPRHHSVQSTGSMPASTSAALARLKGRLPKNPLLADNGDGMRRLDDRVAGGVDQRLLPAGRRSPEHEHDPLGLGVDGADHLIGERLPALALVGSRLPGADRERGVEQQDTLARPRLEVAVAGRLDAEIGAELGVDVGERGRDADTALHREAQPVGLAAARGTDPARGSRRGSRRTASGGARRRPDRAVGTRCGAAAPRRRTPAAPSSRARRTRRAGSGSNPSSRSRCLACAPCSVTSPVRRWRCCRRRSSAGRELPGGQRLWVKRDDLTGLGMGGNKVRKLEFLCGDAIGAGARSLVTVGAAQSNHCRLTAAAGAVLGIEVHLVLSGDRPERPAGNQLLSALFGAQLHYTGAHESHWGELMVAADSLTDALADDGAAPYAIPIGGSTATGALGYAVAFVELMEQCAAGRHRAGGDRAHVVQRRHPRRARRRSSAVAIARASTRPRCWRSVWRRASTSARPTSSGSPARRWSCSAGRTALRRRVRRATRPRLAR